MKIGIYGGAFNPPHMGHVAAARTAIELLGLDALYLIPAGMPPHKDLPSGSPTGRQRLEMARLAGWQIARGDVVSTLDLELTRAGKSYTSETVAALRERHPDDTLWLLMGEDMFLELHNWHEVDRILATTGVAAFGRSRDDTEAPFSRQRERLYKRFPEARLFTFTIPDVVEVSSTEIREGLPKGQGISLLPPAVYGYILREGLYKVRVNLKDLTLPQLRAVSLSYLNHRRIPHVLGTEQEAIRLSLRYGANVDKARRAALLHDCTKRLSMEAQMALCERYGIALDRVERRTLKLLHAKTGAALAKDVFGVDEEIAGAIRSHTTGRPFMTLLEKIIYMADYIEPGRDFEGVEEIRKACDEDLDKGVMKGLELSIREIEERGDKVHRATQEALKSMKGTK